MAIDKKTYNAIKSHLLTRKQIVLASFSEQDVNTILEMLKKDGIKVDIKGNTIKLHEEQTETQVAQIEQKPKEEKKEEAKKQVEVKEEVKLEAKPEPQPVVQQQIAQNETKEEKKQKQKKSIAVHIRLPIEYTNYITSINPNITFALKTIVFEHAKAKGVTLPEPKLNENNITKKERKELKQCLTLTTKEEILKCLQDKLSQ